MWECALRHTSCLAFNELTQACGLSLTLGGKHSNCAGFLPSQPLNTSTCFTFYLSRVWTQVRVCLGFVFVVFFTLFHTSCILIHSAEALSWRAVGAGDFVRRGMLSLFLQEEKLCSLQSSKSMYPSVGKNKISTHYKLFIYQSPGQFLLMVQKKRKKDVSINFVVSDLTGR